MRLIKLLISFVIVFIVLAFFIVYYWINKNYYPTNRELVGYLLLFPFITSVLIIAPFFLKKNSKLNTKKSNLVESEEKIKEIEPEIKPQNTILNLMFPFIKHSLGTNYDLITNLNKNSSPKVDMAFMDNDYDAIITYRISDLKLEQDNMLLKVDRIKAFIEIVFEKNVKVLEKIKNHLNQSAQFYEKKPTYNYKIHQKWIDPDIEVKEEAEIKEVERLNFINIRFILSEIVEDEWEESFIILFIMPLLINLGFIEHKIKIEVLFLNKINCLDRWLNLLEKINIEEEEISFVIVVDSKLDKEFVTYKSANNQKYIPSEFISSCFISSQLLPDLEKNKKVTIIKNADKMKESLEFLEKENLEQYQKDQPFLILLDEFLTHSQHIKFDEMVRDTSIGMHHILNIPNYLGDTQNLADIWKFMLGLQLPKEITSMVISMGKSKHQIFIESENVIDDELHQPT